MREFFNLIGVELNEVSGKEKLVSALGGLLPISLQVAVAYQVLGQDHAACAIASMGASAVLLMVNFRSRGR